MACPTHSTRWRFSWVLFPLAAVLIGGVLGSLAGKQPRDPDPFTVLSPRGSAVLLEAFLIIVAFAAALAAIVFLFSLLAPGQSLRSRLPNGLAVGAFVGLFPLVFVGGGFVLCSALVLLSLWAGMGAGSLRGAAYGATSIGLTLGLMVLCISWLGRFLGRRIVNMKRGIIGIEEDVF